MKLKLLEPKMLFGLPGVRINKSQIIFSSEALSVMDIKNKEVVFFAFYEDEDDTNCLYVEKSKTFKFGFRKTLFAVNCIRVAITTLSKNIDNKNYSYVFSIENTDMKNLFKLTQIVKKANNEIQKRPRKTSIYQPKVNN